MRRIVLALFILLRLGAGCAHASNAFMPLDAPVNAPIVDEPLGARSSLGLTLWHMGHDAGQIRDFHSFLVAQNINPTSLLPASIQVPNQARRILIEPERLPVAQRNGWLAQGEYLSSSVMDAGPDVNIPLEVDRAGLYRGWVRFYGWPTGTGVTSLRVYRAGHEADGPLLNDEIYDYATEKEGPAWKSFMVDLLPGQYTVRLGHVTRQWQSGAGPGGYQERRIDLLYLTDEIWNEAPNEATLGALRQSGTPDALQMSAQPALDAGQKQLWRLWQVRPLSWEQAILQPRLFELSRRFWKQRVDEIGKGDYGTSVPDYRVPARQVVFDDAWNLCANPVQTRRRIQTLRGDLIQTPSPFFSYWLQGSDFSHLEGDWHIQDNALTATYMDFGGTASAQMRVDQPGQYAVWVHFGNLPGYFAPWRATVSTTDGQQVSFDRDNRNYPADWQKLGVLKVSAAGNVRFEVAPLGFKDPGTYRYIYDFLLTTDSNYVPQGNVRPALSLAQYDARARAAGATAQDAYLLWLFDNPYTPLAQEVWDNASWPPPATKIQPVPPSRREITLPSNARRAVQVALRSLRDEPIEVRVSGGVLRRTSGQYLARGGVSWRVVGFVPTGESSRDWSPFLLLRRPFITIPPRSVAGVWLTVDSRNVPPGRYTAQLTFQARGLPNRTVTLDVLVAPPVQPRRPVLVGGWTLPPEGEVYWRDYTSHGMNIWYGEMSKPEMQRRGIKMLALAQWDADEAQIRARIEKLKALGLNYGDWFFSVRDEPGGDTEEALKPFLDVARAIRKVDPHARISFNPGDRGSLKTFQILDPWCDVWLPYSHHRYYPPNEAEAKRAIFTVKPWLWYTTPDLWDKSPGYPTGIYDQIREVPRQPGQIIGTAFFAFYYPWRDAWDAAHEQVPDVGVTVLPSRHGPVATRAWEAIGEGIQDADLAQAVKERAQPGDAEAATLINEGSTAQLLAWLARHPA